MVEVGKTAEGGQETIGDRSQGVGTGKAESTQIQVSWVIEYLA